MSRSLSRFLRQILLRSPAVSLARRSNIAAALQNSHSNTSFIHSISLKQSNNAYISSQSLSHIRSYSSKKKASGNSKGNNSKGRKAAEVKADEVNEFVYDNEAAAALSATMAKGIEKLKTELSSLRVGRANPDILDNIRITHKGSSVPLSEVGQVSVKDGQTLSVTLNDEQHIKLADKAIREAGLGLNPQREGTKNILKVPIPKFNTELRDAMLKSVTQMAEKARAHVRDARASMRNRLSKDNQTKDVENKIQAETDKNNKLIDTLVEAKKKEIGN